METEFFFKTNKNKSYTFKTSSQNYENFQKTNKDSHAIVLRDESFSDSILTANNRTKHFEEISKVKVPKFKEKNLVIKVKKNMIEDENEKKASGGIEENILSPDTILNKKNENYVEFEKSEIKDDLKNYENNEEYADFQPLI